MRYKTLLIFGAPGSGKGTQGKVLGTIPGFFHCACGDVFRSLDVRTPLGKAFLEYSSKGLLVPDETTVELWKLRIRQSMESGYFKPDIDYLILDGIPRSVRQAEIMKDVIDVQHVFHLSCPDRSQLVARLKKRALKDNRLDDANEDVIEDRLATYEAETRPLLSHFGPEMVSEIDALQPPASVLERILHTINSLRGREPIEL